MCPYALAGSEPEQVAAVMLHEIVHALGFTNALFPLFIDPITTHQIPITSIVKSATVGGRRVSRIITPTVVREARAQFNCSTLDGAQLEDEGGDGSAGSHW